MRFPIGLLAPALAVLCALPARAMTEDQLAMNITSLHTRIYGLDNLLVKPFEVAPRNDIDDWRGLMKAVRAFVGENTQDKAMLAALAAMDEASEGLIRERKDSWNICISKCITGKNPDAGLSRLDPGRIRFADLDLDYVIKGNAKLKSLLRKMSTATAAIEPVRKRNAKTKAAANIIDRLSLTLATTIEKFDKDLVALAKEKKARR
jgi:hypothetical protein